MYQTTRVAYTGLTVFPSEGHNHGIYDPGHDHAKGPAEAHLKVLPAPDGHSHQVLDLKHTHSEGGEPAITRIRLGPSHGHSHEVRDLGHRH